MKFSDHTFLYSSYISHRGIKLLVSVDISTRAPWIMQNEQHFVAG
jgi:hypothetical protein